MRIRQWPQVAVAVALVMGAASMQAGLINLGNNNITLSGGVPYYQSGGIKIDGTFEAIGAGLFVLGVNNPSGSPTTGTIYTFCTDVGIYWANDTYTAVQFAGKTGVAPLWGNPAGTNPNLAIQNASWLYNQIFEANPASFEGSASANVLNAVAMQFAIWKALYDTAANGQTSTSFSSGRFTYYSGFSSEAFLTTAQAYLNQLNAARVSGFTTYNDTWLQPNDGHSQGMLYNNLTPVPEPTTMIAGALLLLPFGASTLRFVRKNRAA